MSSLPDELKVGPLPSVDTMNIETISHDPIVSSQSFARFVLEKRGILDAGSVIQLSVHPTDVAGDQLCFLPIKTGIHAAIRRATLRIGSKVVAVSDEYSSYQTLRRSFKTCEEKAFKDQIKAGTVDVLQPDAEQDGLMQLRDVAYGDQGAIATTNTLVGGTGYNVGDSGLFTGGSGTGASYQVTAEVGNVITGFNITDPGRGYSVGDVLTFNGQGNSDATVTVATLTPMDSETFDGIKLTHSQTDTPVFSIKLSELFPAMRNVQLPLYLIAEPCSIELTFHQQAAGTEGVLGTFQSGYGGSTAMEIGLSQLKFIADYLTYSDSRMDEIAKLTMSEDGLVIPFEDIVTISSTFPALAPVPGAGAPQEQRLVRSLGLSGMSVRGICWVQEEATPNSLLGDYASHAHHVPDEFNLRVNDRLMFQRPVSSESKKAHEVSMVFGTEPHIHSLEYSFDITADKDLADQTPANEPMSASTFFLHAQTDLTGTQHFCGVDLTTSPGGEFGTGTRIGSKPVEVIHTLNRTNGDNVARRVRYFSFVERLMSIKGGVVSVSA